MELLKKHWGWLIFVVVGIFAFNNYSENVIKKNEQKRIDTIKSEEFNNRILSVIKETGANYKWINKFANKYFLNPILTIDLQNEWIKNSPIFFVGKIEDITELNAKEYILKVSYAVIDKIPLSTELQLNLVCQKLLIDTFITSNKNVISDLGVNDAIVLIAKITDVESSKITVDSSLEKIGIEVKNLKIGVGKCLLIEPTNEIYPTFSFL